MALNPADLFERWTAHLFYLLLISHIKIRAYSQLLDERGGIFPIRFAYLFCHRAEIDFVV